mmetsp:Transcript_67710/g.177569  ORF Transcript_67710/g.177569 Transcript_67710/m.177569 type:complete len:255 (-) Transcript_67710:675-1439(-)
MKVVGDHHRGSAPVGPEANHGVHAPVARVATIPVCIHKHDAARAARRLAVGLRLARLLHEDLPDRLEAILEGDLELGLELCAEVAHEVEERRKRHRVVLVDGHRVLLPKPPQRHQCCAGKPLHPFHLRVRLCARAPHVEAFVAPVEEAHRIHPGLQLSGHVGHVLLLQDLKQCLDARPLDLHVWLPVLHAVLALAAAGLHVPHGTLGFLDPEVHDRVHHELLEDVLVAARDIGVTQQLLLLLLARPRSWRLVHW